MTVFNHLLLGVAALAVWGGCFRLASTFVDRGLERILVAMTLFTATVVVEAMTLGLFALGGDQAALVTLAIVTGLLAFWLLPRSEVKAGEELSGWVEESSTAAIIGVSTAIGIGAVWTLWSLWSPNVGVDGVYYHLPQIVRWVHEGTPGSVDHINYIYRVGNYPLTNAVAQAWGLGISRSMVMVSIWPMFNLTVLCLAGWVGLRRLRISSSVLVLAILAVATTPVALTELNAPLNDLPALSWLACAAALVICSKPRPSVLVPALIATGLAIGTKTIALPLGIVILGVALVARRRELRQIAMPLAVGFGIFLVVGCFWYARDLIEHGSPFWPWSSSPWGDSVPRFLQSYSSILSHPRDTLQGRLDSYASFMAGSVVLLAAAIALAVLKGDRLLRWMGALVVGLLFLWASAPSTARAPIFDGSVSQTRYLLPVIGAAAALIALASRGSRRLELVSLSVFVIALIWNLGQLFTGSFPGHPPGLAIVAGVVIGVGIGALIAVPLGGRVPAPGYAVGLAATAAAAAALAIPAADWVSHHGNMRENFDAGMAKYLSARADFRDGDQPIWMAPMLAGPLAGDRLQHNLHLIPAHETCAKVARLRDHGWVILLKDPNYTNAIGYSVGGCLARERPLAVIDKFRIYKPLQESETGQ